MLRGQVDSHTGIYDIPDAPGDRFDDQRADRVRQPSDRPALRAIASVGHDQSAGGPLRRTFASNHPV